MPDDLAEAVKHALVRLLTDTSTLLQLAVIHQPVLAKKNFTL